MRRENYQLRRSNEILKAASVVLATELDADRTKGTRSSMRIVIASASSRSAGLWACRGVAYYQLAIGERWPRAVEDERVLELITVTPKRNYEARGYRRTWTALLRAGERVPRCERQRPMHTHGIRGATRRGKKWRVTRPDPDALRRPDLAEPQFKRSGVRWVVGPNLSYLRCCEGVVDFAFVIDVVSRRVVGWQLASHMRTDPVLDALRMALVPASRGADVRLIAHVDRGSPVASVAYIQVLDDDHRVARVRRVGRRRLR